MDTPQLAWVAGVLRDFERLMIKVHPQVSTLTLSYVAAVLAKFGGCPRFLIPQYLADRKSYPALLRSVFHAMALVDACIVFDKESCSDTSGLILPSVSLQAGDPPRFAPSRSEGCGGMSSISLLGWRCRLYAMEGTMWGNSTGPECSNLIAFYFLTPKLSADVRRTGICSVT